MPTFLTVFCLRILLFFIVFFLLIKCLSIAKTNPNTTELNNFRHNLRFSGPLRSPTRANSPSCRPSATLCRKLSLLAHVRTCVNLFFQQQWLTHMLPAHIIDNVQQIGSDLTKHTRLSLLLMLYNYVNILPFYLIII